MFHLNVQNNSDDVQAHVTKPTLVITCVHTLHFTRQYKDIYMSLCSKFIMVCVYQEIFK